ncbi:MAG: asparagine synthase-related protein [Chitinophagaceae bacterium]
MPAVTNYQTATKQWETLVEDAVLSRTIADVPLGVYLSVCIDSTVVAAIVARNAE